MPAVLDRLCHLGHAIRSRRAPGTRTRSSPGSATCCRGSACSASTIGVSPSPNGVFAPLFSFRSFTCTCVMRAWCCFRNGTGDVLLPATKWPSPDSPSCTSPARTPPPNARVSSPRGRDSRPSSCACRRTVPMRSVCFASISHEIARAPERSREGEAVVHLRVRHGVDAVVLDDLDEHAGVLVLLAERRDAIHRAPTRATSASRRRRPSVRSPPGDPRNVSTGCDRISTRADVQLQDCARAPRRRSCRGRRSCTARSGQSARRRPSSWASSRAAPAARRVPAGESCAKRVNARRESPPPQACRGRAVSVS